MFPAEDVVAQPGYALVAGVHSSEVIGKRAESLQHVHRIGHRFR